MLLYGMVLLLLGLLATGWATQGCTSPMLSELAPPHMHNMVYGMSRWAELGSGTVALWQLCLPRTSCAARECLECRPLLSALCSLSCTVHSCHVVPVASMSYSGASACMYVCTAAVAAVCQPEVGDLLALHGTVGAVIMTAVTSIGIIISGSEAWLLLSIPLPRRAIECGAMALAAPLVGLSAERWYGFTGAAATAECGMPQGASAQVSYL